MRWRAAAAACSIACVLGACDNMANQPRRKPFELPYGSQENWPVEPIEGAVSRDAPLHPPGPPPVTMALLERGRERFDIYCAPCHGADGDGNGMIVQRGFPHPPSYYSNALRQAPNQHFYEVITNGYGVMYPYADRVDPNDRWAITAYIRALQASADVKVGQLSPEQRRDLP